MQQSTIIERQHGTLYPVQEVNFQPLVYDEILLSIKEKYMGIALPHVTVERESIANVACREHDLSLLPVYLRLMRFRHVIR